MTDDPTYTFRVHGTPKPQGSKRHVGNGVMVESGGQALRTWREDVKHAALAVKTDGPGPFPLAGPIGVDVTFHLSRPRSHYGSGRNTGLLRGAAPDFPWRRPDLDKLLRSTFDAITTAGLWTDDSQPIYVHARKVYAGKHDAPGASITVETLGSPQ